jgi:amidase
LQKTAKGLEDLGHDVFEAPIEVDWRKLYAAQSTVATADGAAKLAAMIERVGHEPGPDDLEPLTCAGIRYGRKLSGEEVMRSCGTLRVLCREIVAAF